MESDTITRSHRSSHSIFLRTLTMIIDQRQKHWQVSKGFPDDTMMLLLNITHNLNQGVADRVEVGIQALSLLQREGFAGATASTAHSSNVARCHAGWVENSATSLAT
ncbi:hypothetical protein DM01DRAFT_1349695 [Hesseltinella vesiculosa]|uniref:Uncharacterized protein n=1 Tax=Hesseltinella vesiculosa TaxID=101127 RepID=A0A1X2G4F5_9FUNG|nr:hypothetical protein DM01DRAFT_1349695 [Hesseltinella vesiculosa]